MGFAGAGGLGQLMDQASNAQRRRGGQHPARLHGAGFAAADGLSGWLRRSLDTPNAHPCCWLGDACRNSIGKWRDRKFPAAGNRLRELFTADAARSMAEFFLSFFPPDLSTEWLAKVAKGVWETLPSRSSAHYWPPLPGCRSPCPGCTRRSALCSTRFARCAELVWATITALAVGLGLFAGALALALHTTGVLGRLYAEAFDNAPAAPAQALLRWLAPPQAPFLYGTLPGAAPQLIAYTLYRWK
ncbi:MAG: hypothetical protein MZW92_08220 [Comamonadaceae bacterium]|nr:hypothetical protein [Comamonadaceae bacterium]